MLADYFRAQLEHPAHQARIGSESRQRGCKLRRYIRRSKVATLSGLPEAADWQSRQPDQTTTE